MASERSKQLHNFSLPYLKWGNQRFLRCIKIPSNADEQSPTDHRSSGSELEKSDQFRFTSIPTYNSKPNPVRDPGLNPNIQMGFDDDSKNNNIEAVREKLLLDLRVEAKRLKVSILGEGAKDESSAEATRPWNLRSRRTASNFQTEQVKMNNELRSSPEKKERPKFSVSLSKQEIEEDFAAMVGTRPPRRPKKRSRTVQKQLDVRKLGFLLLFFTLSFVWFAEKMRETERASSSSFSFP